METLDSQLSLRRSGRLVLSPSERRSAVLDALRASRRELILSVFRCDDLSILDEITAAIQRGVSVRVLMTRHAKQWGKRLKGLAALLTAAGARVKRYEGPFEKYHAKYLVADDAIALIATFNLTVKCFSETCDFLLITQHEDVIRGLKAIFDTDCQTPVGPLPEVTDRLIVGPEQTRSRFIDFLSTADKAISIIDDRVTDPEIVSVLESKRKAGVTVTILGRGRLPGMACHGRTVIVDNRRALIGSVALSSVSLDSRREVAIVIDEPDCVQELTHFFDYCAAHAPQVSPEDLMSGNDNDDDDEDDDDI